MSGKRDSNPRPQPWQGCALPTELFPHYHIILASASSFAPLLVSPPSNRPSVSRARPLGARPRSFGKSAFAHPETHSLDAVPVCGCKGTTISGHTKYFCKKIAPFFLTATYRQLRQDVKLEKRKPCRHTGISLRKGRTQSVCVLQHRTDGAHGTAGVWQPARRKTLRCRTVSRQIWLRKALCPQAQAHAPHCMRRRTSYIRTRASPPRHP